MNQIVLAITVVAGLVVVRLGLGNLRKLRLKRCWERASAALDANDLDGAEYALRQCVRLVPLFVPARSMLGVVQARQGKLDEAEKQLRMAAELQPKEAGGYVALGLFYAGLGNERADDAVAALGKAVECAPDVRDKLREDTRLDPLHNHPGFQQLIAPSEAP